MGRFRSRSVSCACATGRRACACALLRRHALPAGRQGRRPAATRTATFPLRLVERTANRGPVIAVGNTWTRRTSSYSVDKKKVHLGPAETSHARFFFCFEKKNLLRRSQFFLFTSLWGVVVDDECLRKRRGWWKFYTLMILCNLAHDLCNLLWSKHVSCLVIKI